MIQDEHEQDDDDDDEDEHGDEDEVGLSARLRERSTVESGDLILGFCQV